jgi:superfamily II DNA/RNA helicase
MFTKATISIPSFSQIKLIPELISVLTKMDINSPTVIQAQAISSILNNSCHHMIAAQTGTGKTLSYILPLFQILKEFENQAGCALTKPFSPKALIVVPNRDLSIQCESVLSKFKHEVRLKTFSSFSGQKWNIECEQLEKGVDILVSTPERVDRHRRDGNLNFDDLSHLIIDESDTMIDAGFIKHLDLYCQELSKRARISFFSATFPRSLELFLKNHFSFEEGQDFPYIKRIIEDKTHLNLSHLKHEFIQLQEYDKNPLFLKVLEEMQASLKHGSCIVFCNSIQSARATEHLLNENGFKTVSLHGDIPSKQRQSNIESFREQKIKYLVCTDLGSRGLDFPFVKLVVQYDFPRTCSDYIHRAGRAGRAGSSGSVITLYRIRDRPMVNEFKLSYEKKKPLNVTSSSYSLQNKEFIVKSKQSQQQKLKNILHKTKK